MTSPLVQKKGLPQQAPQKQLELFESTLGYHNNQEGPKSSQLRDNQGTTR